MKLDNKINNKSRQVDRMVLTNYINLSELSKSSK